MYDAFHLAWSGAHPEKEDEGDLDPENIQRICISDLEATIPKVPVHHWSECVCADAAGSGRMTDAGLRQIEFGEEFYGRLRSSLAHPSGRLSNREFTDETAFGPKEFMVAFARSPPPYFSLPRSVRVKEATENVSPTAASHPLPHRALESTPGERRVHLNRNLGRMFGIEKTYQVCGRLPRGGCESGRLLALLRRA